MSEPQTWWLRSGHDDVAQVAEFGQAGDALRRGGHPDKWRGLRRQLTARGLVVAAVGERYHLVPAAAVAELPHLQSLAHDVRRRDVVALRVLGDLLEDLGIPRETASLFAESCRQLPERPEPVPGGDPWQDLRLQHPDEVAQAIGKQQRRRHLHYEYADGEPVLGGTAPPARATKLSRLQRSLLQRLSDFAFSALGAPWSLLRQRGRAKVAALSRALRRLEERGLAVRTRDDNGRTTNVRLTEAGVRASQRG